MPDTQFIRLCTCNYEVMNMTTQEILERVAAEGQNISYLARLVNRTPTTINKWLHGHTNLAPDTEQKLREELKRIQQVWINLDI